MERIHEIVLFLQNEIEHLKKSIEEMETQGYEYYPEICATENTIHSIEGALFILCPYQYDIIHRPLPPMPQPSTTRKED